MGLGISLWVGQWADRVHALAQLYREISTDAACRLVAIWRDAAQAESSPVHAEPVPWQARMAGAVRALAPSGEGCAGLNRAVQART
jgi:hypothetical protein